jgi:hypothetical protein
MDHTNHGDMGHDMSGMDHMGNETVAEAVAAAANAFCNGEMGMVM